MRDCQSPSRKRFGSRWIGAMIVFATAVGTAAAAVKQPTGALGQLVAAAWRGDAEKQRVLGDAYARG